MYILVRHLFNQFRWTSFKQFRHQNFLQDIRYHGIYNVVEVPQNKQLKQLLIKYIPI